MSDYTAVAPHFYRGAPQDPHQRRRHQAVLDLLRGLEGSLLDYGCGYGDLTWAMAQRRQARGVDVDAARVAFARGQYAPVPFEVCAEQGLDFADASFDIVCSIVVLPFVPDPLAYLREAHRILRPDGHLLLGTHCLPFLTRLRRRLARADEDRPGPGGRWTPPAPQVERWLHESGFWIVRRSCFYDPPFELRRHFADYVNGLVEVAGERLGWIGTAPYPLFLARRLPVRA